MRNLSDGAILLDLMFVSYLIAAMLQRTVDPAQRYKFGLGHEGSSLHE